MDNIRVVKETNLTVEKKALVLIQIRQQLSFKRSDSQRYYFWCRL